MGAVLQLGPKWMRLLLDMPFVGIAIFNARTQRWVRFNERFCSIIGYTHAELMRLSWREICHPGDAAESAESLQRLMVRHSQHESLRQRLVRKDGSVVCVDIDASDVRPRSGTENFVIALVKPSPAGGESTGDERYRLLWDSCHVAVVLIDTGTWRFVDANPAAQEFYGWPPHATGSMGLDAWGTSPEGLAQAQVGLKRAADGDATRFEATHRVAKGAVRDVEVYCGRAPTEGRGIVYGVIHDITSRKELERELVDSEQRFRAVVEQSIAAVYVVQDGAIVYVNPHMREIFGYAPGEPFDTRPLAHIRESDWPKVVAVRERRSKGECDEATYSLSAMRKDGSEFTLGIHSSLTSYRGRPAVIAIAKDVTEQLHAEEDARRHMAALKQAMHSTIEVVSIIGEMRDPYTHGHERRVGELAATIGAEMGLDDNRVEGIRIAGYLHDIGKISVPAELLAKPTRLTPAEFELIKGHAQQSYEILKGVEFPWPVARVALQHHERLDGSGYPQGLEGDAILLEARIMSVADVVEAMSSHRPYRPGLGIERALEEIERGRGVVFDPDVVDACLRAFRQRGYVLSA